MRQKLAWLLAAILLLGSAAACTGGKGQPSGEPKGDPGQGRPAGPQAITLNLGEEPPTLDSVLATTPASFDILNNVMEGLIRLGEGFKLLPGMAAEWSTPDHVHYTFKLRPDAKWSDGQPVTAHDFKYAWLRAIDPLTASEYSYQLYEFIEGAEEYATLKVGAADFAAKAEAARERVAITVEDDFTLKVKLIAPTPYWLSLTAFPTYLPQRQDFVEQQGEGYASGPDSLLFNGPFVIASWGAESGIILRKNPTYWDAGNVALEEVTFGLISDPGTALQQYEAGELDRVTVPGDHISKYSSAPGFSAMAEASTVFLTFNTARADFQHAKLRKVFSLALNRKSLAEQVLRNGSVPAEGLVPNSMPGEGGRSFRELSGGHLAVEGSRSEAQRLWEEVKKELQAPRLTVTILHSDASSTRRYAEGLQQMLQEALPGLTVQLEGVPFEVRRERARSGSFDLLLDGWIGDYHDPLTFMHLFVKGSPYNASGWSNAQYDQLIKQARTAPDATGRMGYMAQAEAILLDELPVLPLYHPARNRVTRPSVKGILDFPLGASTDLKGAYVEREGQ